MKMLCFVSFLLMVSWNLHMPGVEIYIQCECSAHGLLNSMHTIQQVLTSTHHMSI